MSLLEANPVYKPFKYPWAYEAWLTQQRIHWLPEEVPLADDVKDWQRNLSEAERNLLTQIFRFFTQADIEVQDNCYMEALRPGLQTDRGEDDAGRLRQYGDHPYRGLRALLLETIGMPESPSTRRLHGIRGHAGQARLYAASLGSIPTPDICAAPWPCSAASRKAFSCSRRSPC